jgi:hypothetical protein
MFVRVLEVGLWEVGLWVCGRRVFPGIMYVNCLRFIRRLLDTEVAVIKRMCGLLFVFVILQLGWSSPLKAQSSNPCLSTTLWFFPLQIPTGWAYYGPYPAPYEYVIWAWNASCPPAAAGKETCPLCPKAAQPISLATGTTYVQQTDVKIPGLGSGLTLSRTWISSLLKNLVFLVLGSEFQVILAL